jgi:hypothetical protein
VGIFHRLVFLVKKEKLNVVQNICQFNEIHSAQTFGVASDVHALGSIRESNGQIQKWTSE